MTRGRLPDLKRAAVLAVSVPALEYVHNIFFILLQKRACRVLELGEHGRHLHFRENVPSAGAL